MSSSTLRSTGPPSQIGQGSSSDVEEEKLASSERGQGRVEASTEENAPKKATIMDKAKVLWAKTQLDVPTMKTMAKGALAPTICLAAYQATPFADTFTTLGYLVGIISVLSFAIMPRAKFLQTFFFNLIATCLATAVALLAMFCAVQARLHTETLTRVGGAGTSGTPTTGAPTATYNSSASAVCGIWLFVQIYLVNTMRARNPQLMIPGIIWCILANVSMVYAPQFPTMTAAISFAKRLIESFMTGFAIGGGVSIFIFPVTMRHVVFKEMTGYIMMLRKLMKSNIGYLQSLEEADMFFPRSMTNDSQRPKRSPEAEAVKAVLAGLAALHGKLSVDLTFAKREIAIGRLGPDDLQEIFRRLRVLLLPIMGVSSVVEVFERIAEEREWNHPAATKSLEEIDNARERARFEAVEDYHAIMKTMREPFIAIAQDIDDGLQHVLITLQLIKAPKKKADSEAKGDRPQPGEDGFTEYLEKRVHAFHSEKHKLLMRWCELRGIKLAPNFFDNPETAEFEAPEWYKDEAMHDQRKVFRARLYIVLYIDYLLDCTALGVQDFVQFANGRVKAGKLSKKRLIFPGVKRLKKWAKSAISRKADSYNDEEHGMNEDGNQSSNVYMGEAFGKRKDPEHLPPQNGWEKFGNRMRDVSHFVRSPESVFGFRVACATMCLAIVAYLHDTQVFYVTQRLFWSQIMVTISMSPSAGQSVFSFTLRLLGSFAAMVSSLIIYYIVNGHTAGVIVFFWFFVSWGFYVILKYPRIVPVGMIYSVTNTLIIGYALQAKKLGIAASESNGQVYYPIYILAPYRCAMVAAGLLVAFFWTIFPYPISEHSQLRNKLGSSLYLLANYYSVVQETVRARILGGDIIALEPKNSPAHKLEKMRQVVFSKSVLILESLRTSSSFVKYDVPVGGKFPKATYDRITSRIQDILNFTSLISYSSRTFSEMYQPPKDGEKAESEKRWITDFRRIVSEVNVTSKEITTLLTLLSASVASGQPLPPYLNVPEPYRLSARLEQTDRNILSVRHMAEPGFAAFAVMQISTKCVSDDIKALLADVKELVGELDFSFHVISTQNSTPNDSSDRLLDGEGDKGKLD
ncbi:hypothetical protein MBLNU459_g2913t1 [Dothideomycetes sp. NU459]